MAGIFHIPIPLPISSFTQVKGEHCLRDERLRVFFYHYFSLFSSGKPDGQDGSRSNTFQLVPYVPLTATSRQPRHRGSQLCRAADGRGLPAARMVALVGWEHELWQFWIQHNSPPPSRVMKSRGRSCEFEVVFSLRLFLGQRCTGIWG